MLAEADAKAAHNAAEHNAAEHSSACAKGE